MGIEINGQAIESIKMNGEDILQLLVNGFSVWKKEISPPYYLFDDFNRTTLGTTPVVGPDYTDIMRVGPIDPEIIDNQLTTGTSSAFLLFERPSTHWKIEVNTSGDGRNVKGFGVALGYYEPGTYNWPQFYIGWGYKKLELRYHSNPTTTLKSVPMETPLAYKMEVEVDGTLVTVWFDGELVMTHRITQTSNLHSKIGLYGSGKADSLYCYDLS